MASSANLITNSAFESILTSWKLECADKGTYSYTKVCVAVGFDFKGVDASYHPTE